MKNKFKLGSLTRVSAVLCLIALTGCTKSCQRSSDPSTKSGSTLKVLNIHRTSAYRSLDPVKQFDQASSELIQNLYDTVLQYSYLKRPYQLETGLLETMPLRSADKLTYTFTLRKGVKFHDDECFEGGKGRELNSDDVIYTFKRFADANTNLLSYTILKGAIVGLNEFREATKKAGEKTDYSKLDISGIKKIDDHSFSMKVTRVNPLALYPLAMSQLSIVPHEAVKFYGNDFEHHPVGTGPYIMKDNQRRGEMIMIKNQDYWATYPTEGEAADRAKGLLADAGKKLPMIDEIRLPLVEEAQPAILSFQRGDLDVVGIDKDNFGNFMAITDGKVSLLPKWENKIKFTAIPGLSMECFKFNMKDPVVGGYTKEKIALRQALAHAINTANYIELMMNGRAMRLNSIVPHPIAGSEWTMPAEYYEYNVEEAKKKLQEAGYPKGEGLPEIVFEYRASTTQTRQQWEFVRNELANVGIKARANFQTFSAWLQKTEQGNFQISGAGWMADYPDAENFYQLLYGPNTPPGPNDGSYKNAEYDELYEQMRFMENTPERFAKMQRMNEIIKAQVPSLLLYNAMRVGLITPWVKNLKRNIMYHPPLKYLDIDLKRKAEGM
jgi:oligopeptide transport system substrate-binding protein